MRNTQGIPALIRLLNDPDRHVRRRAAKALTRIADKSAVIPLMNALNDSERRLDTVQRKHWQNWRCKSN
jgi:HEAT repeat protein